MVPAGILVTVAAAATCIFATPLKGSSPRVANRDLVKKHAHVQVPRDWEMLDVHLEDHRHTISLQIGLKQEILMRELFFDKQLDVALMTFIYFRQVHDGWLTEHGIDISTAVSRSAALDWLKVTVPISLAEILVGAKYNVFRNKVTGARVIRTLEYSVPRRLANHIDVVQPTTFFGFRDFKTHSHVKGIITNKANAADTTKSYTVGGVPSSCNDIITPSCLRTLYNSINYTATQSAKNLVGVAGYLNQYANYADLQTFFLQYRPDATGSSFTTVQVNGGGNDQSHPGVEANLDIQHQFPDPHVYYSTGGSPPYLPDSNTVTNTNEPYAEWLNYLANQTTIPQTITTSYGDDEQTVPLDYATRVCNTFAQLGALGVSLLFSSGDGGVGAGNCTTNDGTNQVKFLPIFPASCPFVTSVGGTTRVSPEVGVSFSQGGFSNYFARPSYQSAAVSSFFQTLGATYSGYYNASGRGFPDISAQGDNFSVVVSGITHLVGGTSASSPTAASIIALLNDFRLSQGKPSLGFLNPWLYSTGYQGLNDITSGNNPGCGTKGFLCWSRLGSGYVVL
ncbi:hypothetical protein BS47DRAFT_1394555 [Hydnum rufescens UP504]|uniref:tripeptidyl-peptidase II n=1 Tax=Hydnum rufescens UP504 TaxID=1448309 RepID=A0A9P6AUW3_9AGAM|nr:hypothetical protein BS47DRAFT_1394555 [Hydnum rufescens UP504]